MSTEKKKPTKKKETVLDPPSKPVLWWIYETKSNGANGVLVMSQTAFRAWKEAQKILGLELSDLTVVMGGENAVLCKITVPVQGPIVDPTK